MSPKGKNSPQKTISPYVKSPIFHRKVSHEEYPGPETTLNTTSATTTPTKPIRRSSSAKDLMRLAIGPDGHSSFRTFSGEDHVDSKGLKPSRYQSRKVNNEAGPSFLAKKRQSDDDDDSSEFLAYSKGLVLGFE